MLHHCNCNGALSCSGYCKKCQFDMQALEKCGCEKTAVYELLKTGMVGGSAQVFTRYREKDITLIRSHVHEEKSKLTKGVVGYDANSLYLYCSGGVVPCGKDALAVNKKPFDQKKITKFSKDVLKGKVFGFPQVDIEVPDELYDKFSGMSPLFVVQEILHRDIPEEMKIYKETSVRQTVKGTKKLLGVMKAKKIVLYTPLIELYLQHGLRLTAVHQLIECEPGMPFSWFPDEEANARREADNDPPIKQLSNVAKLKGNSFYGKMIEDLGRHKSTKFTRKKRSVDKALRSLFFDHLEETGGAYEIKELKRSVMIKRPYQCGIAVYQLAKLQMLEFYYDFLDKYFSRQDFELCYMDTDSFYLAMSGDSLDEIVRPEKKQECEAEKKNWLATEKFSERTSRLFQPEFVGTSGVWLTAKCCLVQNEVNEDEDDKYSCKGVSKKHNDLHFQRYKDVLGVFLKTRRDTELEEKDIDKAENVGFKVGVVTYEQNKLGLSGYYDKRYVLADGIHTRPLDF